MTHTELDHARIPERADLAIRTAASAAFHERARRVAPLGVIGGGRYWRPYPLAIAKAAGARLWDVDGNEYIDYHASYGPSVLGQNHPEVGAAVVEAIQEQGVLFALPHEAEIALCEKVVEHIPSAEKVILTCAGTEATYHAIRVARAFTGRERIVKFEGHYHGWHDAVQQSLKPSLEVAGPPEAPATVPVSAGTPAAITARTTVLGWNDADALAATLAREGDEVACVILEPISHACGVLLPAPGFLERVRELCIAHGVLLIFDEMITGFRHALGGCQALFGVTPDLTTFGKGVANGFPISGLAGRADVMGWLEPEGPVSYSGTFNGALICAAAALKTIEILEREPVHERLFALGGRFRDEIGAEAARLGLPVQCVSFGSMWCVYFTDREIRDYRDIAAFAVSKDTGIDAEFQGHLLSNGVYMQPFYTNRCFTSYAHSDADVDRTIEVVGDFLRTRGRAIEAAYAAAYG
jgi:glutamate-1-semialdehyde 2,1-aminomutase